MRKVRVMIDGKMEEEGLATMHFKLSVEDVYLYSSVAALTKYAAAPSGTGISVLLDRPEQKRS